MEKEWMIQVQGLYDLRYQSKHLFSKKQEMMDRKTQQIVHSVGDHLVDCLNNEKFLNLEALLVIHLTPIL